MAIQVGRAGADTGLPLPSPTTVSRDGDRVTLKGNLWSETSIALGRVLRDQVIGLDPANSPGMPVRPVIYAPGDISRYGRVLSASVPSSRAAEATGVWPYDIDIEWVRSSHAPLFQNRLLGALRVNDHGITTANTLAWGSLGGGAYGVDTDGVATTPGSQTGSDGPVWYVADSSETAFNAAPTWYVAPADFYKGGAAISQVIGSAGYRIVGREMPNIPTTWALSNSIVTVLGSATANEAEFTVFWHDGTQAESFKTFRFTQTGATYVELDIGPVLVTILRNTPELCALRVHYGAAGGLVYIADFALRRASPYVEIYPHNLPGWGGPGVKLMTAEALTAITGGGRATSNDAGGNKLVLASSGSGGIDAVNGRIWYTDPGESIMIGNVIGGTVGSGFGQTQGLVYQYMAAVAETQSAVIP